MSVGEKWTQDLLEWKEQEVEKAIEKIPDLVMEAAKSGKKWTTVASYHVLEDQDFSPAGFKKHVGHSQGFWATLFCRDTAKELQALHPDDFVGPIRRLIEWCDTNGIVCFLNNGEEVRQLRQIDAMPKP